jgi:iron complex transport system ATP-binding protein
MSRFERLVGSALADFRPSDDVAQVAPGAVALSAEGVGYRVGARWLVRGVDLELRAGRVLVVVGPNGAGKSTLLSLLAGDESPSEGSVTVAGKSIRDLPASALARRRAVLTQRVTLAFPFTVREVVEMGRAPWVGTAAGSRDDEVVAAALRDTDMAGFADRRFPTLSGGEQGRASFARVLAQETGVLLLDEPTAALDLRHQEQLMQSARAGAQAGLAVLVVLHDLQLAAAYADEVAVLQFGRLIARGAPRSVFSEELLSVVYELPIEVVHHPDDGSLLIGPRRGPRVPRLPVPAPHSLREGSA